MHAGAVVFDAGQAVGRRGVAGWTARHQAWLYAPMLTFEGLNLHVSSVRALLRPGLRHRRVEVVLLGVHAAAYVALLAVALTWQQALVFVVVHQAVFGVYLGMSFAPGHKGMPVLDARAGRRPAAAPGAHLAQRARRAARECGDRRAELPDRAPPVPEHAAARTCVRAQRVVRRFCDERGVSYAEVSVVAAYAAVVRHLDAVGADLRAARATPRPAPRPL